MMPTPTTGTPGAGASAANSGVAPNRSATARKRFIRDPPRRDLAEPVYARGREDVGQAGSLSEAQTGWKPVLQVRREQVEDEADGDEEQGDAQPPPGRLVEDLVPVVVA